MPRNQPINPDGETLDRICGELEIYQARRGYRFGLETLLLAGFVQTTAERLLDLGTGSGVLPLVLTRFGKAGSAVGIELQASLVDRASRSVDHNDLAERVEIIEADLRKPVDGLSPSSFDLVVSNPPYGKLGSGNRNPNEEKALARHELECTLADVVAAAGRYAKVRGRFAVVVPPSRLVELTRLCQEADLTPCRLRLAHGRVGMPARHCLLEATRGVKSELEVEPPLIVYQDLPNEDVYTEEVQAMLYPTGS